MIIITCHFNLEHAEHVEHEGIGKGINMNVGKLLERVNETQEDILDARVSDTIDSLICKTLEEISERYESGALEWAKKERTQEWQTSLVLQGEINEAALRKDVEALKRVLAKYEGFMLSMIGGFSSIRGG